MALKQDEITNIKNASTDLIYAYLSESAITKYFPTKYAKIVSAKRTKQIQFMNQTARAGNVELSEVSDIAWNAIIETYGFTPHEVLEKLMKGETVRGKNWKEGVFGVGATETNSFSGTNITVGKDEKGNPHFFKGGNIVYDSNMDVIFGTVGTETDVVSIMQKIDGTLYSADLINGNWVSADFQKGGKMYKASDGLEVEIGTAIKDSSNVWKNGTAVVSIVNVILAWILDLFNIKTVTGDDIKISQTRDGFVTNTSTSNAGGGIISWLLLLGGGFALWNATKDGKAQKGKGKKGVKLGLF